MLKKSWYGLKLRTRKKEEKNIYTLDHYTVAADLTMVSVLWCITISLALFLK